MTTIAIEEKVCTLCQRDCSNEPRFRDDDGRYFHQSCHEQSTATPTPKPLTLAQPSSSTRRTCTSCNRIVHPGVVRCYECEESLKGQRRPVNKPRRVEETDIEENELTGNFFAALLLVPALSMIPLAGPFFVIGAILLGFVHLVVEAFREHLAWGIMVVLGSIFPLFWMAFVVVHWNRAKRAFVLILTCIGTFLVQLAMAA